MTRQELRVFLQSWFCGCGQPELASARLRDILALAPFYDHRKELEALIPDKGVEYLILYMLDSFDLIEHGCGIGGSWLTDKGRAMLEALQREAVDDFEALHADFCMHGYDIEGPDSHCVECER